MQHTQTHTYEGCCCVWSVALCRNSAAHNNNSFYCPIKKLTPLKETKQKKMEPLDQAKQYTPVCVCSFTHILFRLLFSRLVRKESASRLEPLCELLLCSVFAKALNAVREYVEVFQPMMSCKGVLKNANTKHGNKELNPHCSSSSSSSSSKSNFYLCLMYEQT